MNLIKIKNVLFRKIGCMISTNIPNFLLPYLTLSSLITIISPNIPILKMPLQDEPKTHPREHHARGRYGGKRRRQGSQVNQTIL